MKKIIVFFIYLTMGINILFAQDIESNIKERLTDYFNKYTATAKISTPKLNSFDIDYDRKTIAVYASESFAYQPFRSETVETIYNQCPKTSVPYLFSCFDKGWALNFQSACRLHK